MNTSSIKTNSSSGGHEEPGPKVRLQKKATSGKAQRQSQTEAERSQGEQLPEEGFHLGVSVLHKDEETTGSGWVLRRSHSLWGSSPRKKQHGVLGNGRGSSMVSRGKNEQGRVCGFRTG